MGLMNFFPLMEQTNEFKSFQELKGLKLQELFVRFISGTFLPISLSCKFNIIKANFL